VKMRLRAIGSMTKPKGRMADPLVLCYHAISEDWPADLSITTTQLREQLELVLKWGYRGATFHDAVASSWSEPTVVVTFDDAFSSVLERAYPILSSLGLPGTVFVVTDFADRGQPMRWPGIDHWLGGVHEPELRGLSWRQLEQMANAGWEIGSHTRTHPRLTKLPDDELANELRGSREACENALGRACRSLAYPYGDFDSRVGAAAARAGYEAAATLPSKMSRPTALAWPRVGIYHNDSLRRFRVKVSPRVRRVRTVLGPVEELLRW
jgi:peptidoglycan/xylan/chitin deacetylase (PgdA/CDA1 family)